MKTNSWGGARANAGRKRNPHLAQHLSREIKRNSPVLITLVLRASLPALQDAEVFTAFHKAAQRARRHGLRMIEYAVYEKKLFMLCEFKNRKDLESSMKSLATTLAIAVKKVASKQNDTPHNGPVFLGRFRMETLSSAEEVVNAQLRMMPVAEKDFAYSSLLCMSPLKASKVFSRMPLLQSTRDEAAPRENAEDVQRSENILEFIQRVDQDPRYLPQKKEAITSTASPQFPLTQSAWLRNESLFKGEA